MTLAQIAAWVLSCVGVVALFWSVTALIPMRKVDRP